jgi:hypothetical protein
MFTRNIKHTVQIRKCGVRWFSGPSGTPGESVSPENVDSLLARAKEKIESNKKQSDHLIAGRDING